MNALLALSRRTAALTSVLVATEFLAAHAWGCPPHAFRAAYVARPVYVARPAYVARPVYSVPYVQTAVVASPPPMVDDVAEARQALKQRQFDLAVRMIDQALQRSPNSSDLLQLKSLVLMLHGDFTSAAAFAHAGLSSGVLLNRPALLALVPTEAEYAQRLQMLQSKVRTSPDNADFQFLLAYHLLSAGDTQAGRTALLAARDRLPNDQLIPVLLAQLAAN